MGIKLVEEVMDWCPDDVTPAQRWCLTVLARDANDGTRETYHGPEDPEIVRRVRMSPKKWEAMRSVLLKRGLIEPVSGGYRGRTVRYRIASLFPPCVVQDWRKTPLERGAFGGYAPKPQKKDPPTEGGQSRPKTPQDRGGFPEKDPPTEGALLLSTSSSSFSPPPPPYPSASDAPPEPPAAPSNERENSAPLEHDDAAKVATAWTAARGGRRNPTAELEVRKSAATLLAAGWHLPDVIDLAEDMARRQPTYINLGKHEPHWKPRRLPARAAAPAAPALPDWCKHIDCDEYSRNREHRDAEGFLRRTPCPDCHPDHIKDQAA